MNASPFTMQVRLEANRNVIEISCPLNHAQEVATLTKQIRALIQHEPLYSAVHFMGSYLTTFRNMETLLNKAVLGDSLTELAAVIHAIQTALDKMATLRQSMEHHAAMEQELKELSIPIALSPASLPEEK